MNPAGNRDVFPIMRPDCIFVSVAVVRLVEALTVAPKRLAEVKIVELEKVELVKFAFVKLAEVKLQFENTELDKFSPVKSNEDGNVSDE